MEIKIHKLLLFCTSVILTVIAVSTIALPMPIFAQAQTTPLPSTPPIIPPSDINLTVLPPVSYLHVAPGTTVNHTIILENSGETEITVLPTIVDFTTDGKTGRVIVTNQLTFPYISIGKENSITEVAIPPKKKAQLTLTISVPREAEEKEYPMTVLFFSKTEMPLANQSTTYSQVNAAVGSNLIVLVSKQNVFHKVLSIIDLHAPKLLDSFQDLSFVPLVKNESLGAVTASGSAKIVNWRKQTIAEFEIYPDVVLSHNSRELRALLSHANPEKPEVSSFSYHPRFLLGPYQIIVTLTNEQDVVITQSVHVFYAIPIVVLFVITIGIVISVYFSKIKPKTMSL